MLIFQCYPFGQGGNVRQTDCFYLGVIKYVPQEISEQTIYQLATFVISISHIIMPCILAA